MNRATLMGNLGNDADLRYTQGGQAYLRMRLATEESYQDKDGVWQQRAEWHSVVVWGRKAEVSANRCRKGRPVLVSGRLRTREWTTKEGESRTTTELVAQYIKVFDGYAKIADQDPVSDDAATEVRGRDERGDDIPF